MFEGSVFLIIEFDQLDDEVSRLESILKSNGGTVLTKKEHDNSINYLVAKQHPRITHIITKSVQFIEYNLARNSMIDIVTPDWVYESVKGNRSLNPKAYNPDPKFFLKDCFVCVADNLPSGDKEAIYGGVRAFGGSYLDVLTKYTTHLIAIDLTNEKSIIASSAINSSATGEKIDIKIVLPHWIDHCLTVGKKLNETPYLLPNPPILKNGKHSLTPDLNTLISAENIPEDSDFNSTFFESKTFYIASDYNLSERLTNSIKTLIENNGGKVASSFDTGVVDVYIGKYRTGQAFVESCTSNRIIVGNLHWLYDTIATNKWVLPENSNLLHYPTPHLSLDKFKGLNISVTNYSGEARSYLSKLITTVGGKFTKTLTKDNDYLIAAKPEGKKYETAKFKWLDENNQPKIKVVNHIWLEECYAKWDLINDDNSKYTYLGNGADSVEIQIGRTKLDENVLKLWYPTEESNEKTLKLDLDIDDSMSEDESTQSKPNLSVPKILKELENSEQSLAKDVPPPLESIEEEAVITSRYGGRSAAKKAALKLHDNMSDLNKFQEIAKSSRKMKSYMELLEGALPSKKRELSTEPEPEPEHTETPQKKQKVKSPVSDKKLHKENHPEYKIVAIMTGCEQELTLSKQDLSKLASIGIKVLSDLLNKFSINTVIAPKILRTEKFLRSLSKVNRIIHPNYLVEILKKLNTNDEVVPETIFKEFSIDDYSLEKFLSAKDIKLELGVSSGLSAIVNTNKKGKLFNGLKLNLSINLNGGVDVISNILKDHGMEEFQAIKNTLTGNSLAKELKTSTLEGKEYIILVGHKTKDSKLIKNFRKLLKDKGLAGEVIEWDWCVKSIFKMNLEPLKDYKL
jgi:hypothetical protein